MLTPHPYRSAKNLVKPQDGINHSNQKKYNVPINYLRLATINSDLRKGKPRANPGLSFTHKPPVSNILAIGHLFTIFCGHILPAS
jgi:hypothetical protein